MHHSSETTCSQSEWKIPFRGEGDEEYREANWEPFVVQRRYWHSSGLKRSCSYRESTLSNFCDCLFGCGSVAFLIIDLQRDRLRPSLRVGFGIGDYDTWRRGRR